MNFAKMFLIDCCWSYFLDEDDKLYGDLSFCQFESVFFLFFILLHDGEINLSNAVDNQILNGSLRCHRLNAAFCILTQCSSSFYNQLFDLIYVTLFVAFLLPHSLLIKRFRSIFILCSFIENEKILRVKYIHEPRPQKKKRIV